MRNCAREQGPITIGFSWFSKVVDHRFQTISAAAYGSLLSQGRRICVRDLATQFASKLCISLSLSLKRGRRECRVRAAPAVSCAKNCTVGAHEHTGERKHSDIPCATALRLTSCSPRWSGLVVTVTPEKLASHELDASIAAPGPHDFAVRSRPGFAKRLRRATAIRLWRAASIASRAQRVVTMAIRPSGGHETAMFIILIFRNAKRNIFARGTGQPKSA